MNKPDESKRAAAQSSTTRIREITVLWMKAQPLVEAFVCSAIRDFQAAEDVVQEVAEAAVEHFDDWNRDSSFSTWTVGIAKNKVRMHLRSNAGDRHIFDEETINRVAWAHEQLESRVDPMKEALQHCLKQLQGRSRRIIEMRYLNAMSPKAIAEKLGLSRNNVFVMLHRVRLALGRCIKTRMGQEDSQ